MRRPSTRSIPELPLTDAAAPRRGPDAAVHGVLLLDKPPGVSSNAALVRARCALDTRKAGHTGTLDPLATGLLVVCLGDATRWAGFGLGDRKTYTGQIRLGTRTATGDMEGDVVETASVPPAPWPLGAIAARFTGTQTQVPPMYSALKRDGRPLYAYARAGATVERPPREITIHALELSAAGPDTIAFEVTCSAGTYVRTLAEDLAIALGTVAHLGSLRRTALGAIPVGAAVGLDRLEAETPVERRARLLPPDTLVAELPKIVLPDTTIGALVAGRSGPWPEDCPLPMSGDVAGGLHRAYAASGRFLGLVRPDARQVRVHRLMPTGQAPGDAAEPSPAEHATD
jgi:tRNA pseudouridine55 synthase